MKLLFYPAVRWICKFRWWQFIGLVQTAQAAAAKYPKNTVTMSWDERENANEARAAYVRQWATSTLHVPGNPGGVVRDAPLNLAIELAVAWLDWSEK